MAYYENERKKRLLTFYSSFIQCFKKRAAEIADHAHNARGALGEGAEFLRGLDEMERQRMFFSFISSSYHFLPLIPLLFFFFLFSPPGIPFIRSHPSSTGFFSSSSFASRYFLSYYLLSTGPLPQKDSFLLIKYVLFHNNRPLPPQAQRLIDICSNPHPRSQYSAMRMKVPKRFESGWGR